MTKTTAKPDKEPSRDQGETTAKPRSPMKKQRRNRAKKQRPESIPDLIAAIDENALDQRTVEARDALALRDALAEHPEATVKGLVRDALALDALVMSRIVQEILRPGSAIVDENGELNPLIVEHWPGIRNGVLKSGRELLRMEPQKAKSKGEADDPGFDLTTILLKEAQGDGTTD